LASSTLITSVSVTFFDRSAPRTALAKSSTSAGFSTFGSVFAAGSAGAAARGLRGARGFLGAAAFCSSASAASAGTPFSSVEVVSDSADMLPSK